MSTEEKKTLDKIVELLNEKVDQRCEEADRMNKIMDEEEEKYKNTEYDSEGEEEEATEKLKLFWQANNYAHAASITTSNLSTDIMKLLPGMDKLKVVE